MINIKAERDRHRADVAERRRERQMAKYLAHVERETRKADEAEVARAKHSFIVREARLIKSIIPHPWGKEPAREW